MAQRKRTWPAPVRTQVPCLASRSALRVRRRRELGCRSPTRLGSGVAVAVVEAGGCSSDSTPTLGTSRCRGCGPQKTKKMRYCFSTSHSRAKNLSTSARERRKTRSFLNTGKYHGSERPTGILFQLWKRASPGRPLRRPSCGGGENPCEPGPRSSGRHRRHTRPALHTPARLRCPQVCEDSFIANTRLAKRTVSRAARGQEPLSGSRVTASCVSSRAAGWPLEATPWAPTPTSCPHKKPGHSSSSHVPNAGRTLSALCPTFKAARSFPAATASDIRPEELRAQAGPGADPPGSWLRASWRDGAAGGWPGPGYRAAGSGPGGSGKPSAQPEGPQPGPSSAGPRAGGTGNTGPLAGTASGPSGSNSGAARRQSKSRSEVTSARCFCRTSFLR